MSSWLRSKFAWLFCRLGRHRYALERGGRYYYCVDCLWTVRAEDEGGAR